MASGDDYLTQQRTDNLDSLFKVIDGVEVQEAVKLLSFALATVAHNIEPVDPKDTAVDLVCSAVRACYAYLTTTEDIIH